MKASYLLLILLLCVLLISKSECKQSDDDEEIDPEENDDDEEEIKASDKDQIINSTNHNNHTVPEIKENEKIEIQNDNVANVNENKEIITENDVKLNDNIENNNKNQVINNDTTENVNDIKVEPIENKETTLENKENLNQIAQNENQVKDNALVEDKEHQEINQEAPNTIEPKKESDQNLPQSDGNSESESQNNNILNQNVNGEINRNLDESIEIPKSSESDLEKIQTPEESNSLKKETTNEVDNQKEENQNSKIEKSEINEKIENQPQVEVLQEKIINGLETGHVIIQPNEYVGNDKEPGEDKDKNHNGENNIPSNEIPIENQKETETIIQNEVGEVTPKNIVEEKIEGQNQTDDVKKENEIKTEITKEIQKDKSEENKNVTKNQENKPEKNGDPEEEEDEEEDENQENDNSDNEDNSENKKEEQQNDKNINDQISVSKNDNQTQINKEIYTQETVDNNKLNEVINDHTKNIEIQLNNENTGPNSDIKLDSIKKENIEFKEEKVTEEQNSKSSSSSFLSLYLTEIKIKISENLQIISPQLDFIKFQLYQGIITFHSFLKVNLKFTYPFDLLVFLLIGFFFSNLIFSRFFNSKSVYKNNPHDDMMKLNQLNYKYNGILDNFKKSTQTINNKNTNINEGVENDNLKQKIEIIQEKLANIIKTNEDLHQTISKSHIRIRDDLINFKKQN